VNAIKKSLIISRGVLLRCSLVVILLLAKAFQGTAQEVSYYEFRWYITSYQITINSMRITLDEGLPSQRIYNITPFNYYPAAGGTFQGETYTLNQDRAATVRIQAVGKSYGTNFNYDGTVNTNGTDAGCTYARCLLAGGCSSSSQIFFFMENGRNVAPKPVGTPPGNYCHDDVLTFKLDKYPYNNRQEQFWIGYRNSPSEPINWGNDAAFQFAMYWYETPFNPGTNYVNIKLEDVKKTRAYEQDPNYVKSVEALYGKEVYFRWGWGVCTHYNDSEAIGP
jgi:hypothetical protein